MLQGWESQKRVARFFGKSKNIISRLAALYCLSGDVKMRTGCESHRKTNALQDRLIGPYASTIPFRSQSCSPVLLFYFSIQKQVTIRLSHSKLALLSKVQTLREKDKEWLVNPAEITYHCACIKVGRSPTQHTRNKLHSRQSQLHAYSKIWLMLLSLTR